MSSRRRISLTIAGSLLLATALYAQFVDYSGSDTTHVFKSIILSGTARGEVTGPEITRVSATEVGLPAVTVTNAVTAGSLAVTGEQTTADGVGAKNGATVAVVETGNGAVHKTVLTLTATSIAMTDAGAAGSHGGTKIYDFPEGVLVRGGCVANATTLAGAGGIADGAAVVLALGVAAPATDNATLVGANEADFVASFAGTLTAGAGSFKKYGEPSVTSLDGHTTPIDLYLNAAVPDADSSATDTLAVTGTVTCIWSSTGDFT